MQRGLLIASSLLVLSCSPSPQDAPPPSRAAAPPEAPPEASPETPPRCGRLSAGPGPVALDTTGTGSGVALGRFAGRTIAYVADEDDLAIHTIDVDAGAALSRTPVAGKPAQALLLRDGRLVVSLRDRATLEVLEPGAAPEAPLERRCLVPVATEPVGLALTPDGETVLSASRWGHTLTAFAAQDLARRGALDLPRDPNAVVISSDARVAFVSHAVGGIVSVVTLDSGTPASARAVPVGGIEWRQRSFGTPMRMPMPFIDLDGVPRKRRRRPSMDRIERAGSQGFALARANSGAIFLPEVLVDPGPSRTGGGYGGAETGTVISQIAILDAAGEGATIPPLNGMIGLEDCFLPRAAAIDPEQNVLLVACLGIDAVIGYEARAPRTASAASKRARELFRWEVATGPTGLAIDTAGRRAVVLSQMEGVVTVHGLGKVDLKRVDPSPTTIQLPRERAPDPQIALGRRLFHAVGTRRIAFDGRACASCHPDGRDDTLTWSTQEGPRQTPMLLGRLDGTAPYGWQGDKKDLPSHFARTIGRLGGTGLGPEERDALFAYVKSLSPPREQEGPASSDAAAKLARGGALFDAEEVGCTSCHLGDDVTTDGIAHDVASATRFEVNRTFETPSLRFVGRSAPYFHDGRYATLAALVRGVDGTMGHTGHLSDEDVEALSLYLESL